MERAKKKLGHWDLEDVDLLALALKLNISIWSNGKDFRTSGIKAYTTAELLKILGF